MLLLFLVTSENTQQVEEEVDEVQIEGEGSEDGSFAADGFIGVEADFKQTLGVVRGEEGKEDDTAAADEEVERADAPEDVDDAGDDEPDEQHEEGAPHGAEVAAGDSAVDGHGAEHDGGAAKGFADGVDAVLYQQRSE